MTLVEQLRQRKTLVPASEVLTILGVSKNTLQAYVKKGELEAYRIANENKFEPVALANYLEARRA